jgi:hypothetical protein
LTTPDLKRLVVNPVIYGNTLPSIRQKADDIINLMTMELIKVNFYRSGAHNTRQISLHATKSGDLFRV